MLVHRKTSSTNPAHKVKFVNTYSSTMQEVNPHGPSGSIIKPIAQDPRFELNLGKCYVDISNIEGVSNGFKVMMDAKTCSTIGPTSKASPSCAPLVCSIPPDWQCPVANRFDQDLSKAYPPTYLDALQSCVSNCTLYGSDEACCKNANNTEQTCTNQNPALQNMCEDTYSYAFDDKRASYVYQLTLDGDTAVHITACP
jgi:hypothetical protein